MSSSFTSCCSGVEVIQEPWSVHFAHGSAPPDGYRLVRLRGAATARSAPNAAGLTIIFLHGAGDGSDAWIRLWSSLFASLPQGTEVLLPSGPFVKGGRGLPRPGWTSGLAPVAQPILDANDVAGVLKETSTGFLKGDFDGIEAVDIAIREVVLAETRRSGRRVALGGFGEGAGVAIWSGLRLLGSSARTPTDAVAASRARIAFRGLFSLSGFLPLPSLLPRDGPPPPPLLLLHGNSDSSIPHEASEAAVRTFEAWGWDESVTFRSFQGLQHGVCREELEYLCEWLRGMTAPVVATAFSSGDIKHDDDDFLTLEIFSDRNLPFSRL